MDTSQLKGSKWRINALASGQMSSLNWEHSLTVYWMQRTSADWTSGAFMPLFLSHRSWWDLSDTLSIVGKLCKWELIIERDLLSGVFVRKCCLSWVSHSRNYCLISCCYLVVTDHSWELPAVNICITRCHVRAWAAEECLIIRDSASFPCMCCKTGFLWECACTSSCISPSVERLDFKISPVSSFSLCVRFCDKGVLKMSMFLGHCYGTNVTIWFGGCRYNYASTDSK